MSRIIVISMKEVIEERSKGAESKVMGIRVIEERCTKIVKCSRDVGI